MTKYVIAVKRNSPKAVAKLCEVAFKEKLYRRDGELRHWLREPSIIRAVAVCFCDKKPVAVAVVRTKWKHCFFCKTVNFSVFVKRNFRRRGIGTHLYKTLSRQGLKILAQENNAPKFFSAVQEGLVTAR